MPRTYGPDGPTVEWASGPPYCDAPGYANGPMRTGDPSAGYNCERLPGHDGMHGWMPFDSHVAAFWQPDAVVDGIRHLGSVCVDNAALSARMRILAYQYEADRHCVDCTLHRFGADSFSMSTGITGRDNEDNIITVVFEDEAWWHEDYEGLTQTLECGTCMRTLSVHHPDNERTYDPEPYIRGEDECECEDCLAAAEYAGPTVDAGPVASTAVAQVYNAGECRHGDTSANCWDCRDEQPFEFVDAEDGDPECVICTMCEMCTAHSGHASDCASELDRLVEALSDGQPLEFVGDPFEWIVGPDGGEPR